MRCPIDATPRSRSDSSSRSTSASPSMSFSRNWGAYCPSSNCCSHSTTSGGDHTRTSSGGRSMASSTRRGLHACAGAGAARRKRARRACLAQPAALRHAAEGAPLLASTCAMEAQGAARGRAPSAAPRGPSDAIQGAAHPDAMPALVRTDAIAKLRRAASQREVRRVSPRRVRVRAADAAPQVVQFQPPMLAAPLLDADGSDGSEARSTPRLTPSTSGDVPRAHSSDALTSPRTGDNSPLPSLDQLRRKILQERKMSGLSRSASASATSRVARAYTMQKLMGATTPVPYNDMFDFVRSVNEARSATIGDEPPAAEVSIDSEPEPESSFETQEESTPPRNTKRATLMRSVSAREVARQHMFQKIVRRERANGEGTPRARHAPSPGDAAAHALPPEAPALVARGAADSPVVSRSAGESPLASRVRAESPFAPGDAEAALRSPPARAPAVTSPLATSTAAWTSPSATSPTTAYSPMLSPSLVRPTYARPAAAPVPPYVPPPAPSAPPSAPPSADRAPSPPADTDAERHTSAASATYSAFSDSSSSTQRTDAERSRRSQQRDTPNNSSEMLAMLQGLSSQLDAEAHEARARRMRGRNPGLARAVSAGSAAAPSARPGTEVLDALGRVEPPAAPAPSAAAPSIARSGTLPSRAPAIGLGIRAPGDDAAAVRSPETGAEAVGSPPLGAADKPLPGLPSAAPARAVPAPALAPARVPGLSPPTVRSPGTAGGGVGPPTPATPVTPTVPMACVAPADAAWAPPRPSFESKASSLASPLEELHTRPSLEGRSDAAPVPAAEPKREGRGARLLGSLRRKTSRSRLAERAQGAPRTPPVRAVVCLQDDVGVPPATRTVVVPLARAALARVCGEDALRRIPGEVAYAAALDPPRKLLRVVPVLQAVGEAYIKLRYLYVFTDVLVLAKPVRVPTQPAELSAYILQRLHTAPDVHEACAPLAVLALQHTHLVPGALVRAAGAERDRAHALRHLGALRTRLGAALPAVVREVYGAADAVSAARLLYLLPELDRGALSAYLFAPAQRAVLDAYVAQHRVAGLPLEAALRVLLLDVRLSPRADDVEALVRALAAHWVASNRAELARAFTPALAADVVHALLALHDALHADARIAPRGAAAPAGIALESFVRAVRERDAAHALSDREVRELFLDVKTHALAQATTAAPRRIVFHAAALAEGLVLGVPSAPVTVALDAPDAHLRLKLVGRDLYCDPPVLTFAHAATAEFTVCSTAPGEHELAFVRVGAHAPLYPPTAEPRGPWRALPRSLSLLSERHTTRPALALQYAAPGAAPAPLHLYLPDAYTAQHVAGVLQECVAAAVDAPHGTPHTLAARVLCAALGVDEHGAPRTRAPPTTGQDLVRTVRENSLLPGVLGAPGSP